MLLDFSEEKYIHGRDNHVVNVIDPARVLSAIVYQGFSSRNQTHQSALSSVPYRTTQMWCPRSKVM